MWLREIKSPFSRLPVLIRLKDVPLLYIVNIAVAMDNQAEMVFQTDGTLEIGFMDIAQTMVGSVIHLYSEKSRKDYIKR